jgi:hypothetical protein
MNRPCVIVCERSGKWAAALRPCLPVEIPLRQTRGLGECALELAAAPSSLLAVELNRENAAGVLSLLNTVGRRFPLAVALVLAERGLESHEWLLREAGAVHFTTSPREADDVARLALRHFSRQAAPAQSLATRIWDALPWSEAARS